MAQWVGSRLGIARLLVTWVRFSVFHELSFPRFEKFLSFLAGTSIVLNADYITSAGTATLKFPIPAPVH